MDPNIRKELGFFYPAINFIILIATAVHLILSVYFSLIGIFILVVYNILGVGILFSLKFWLKKDGPVNFIFGLIVFIILVHSFVATFVLGVEGGTLNYIIVLPIILLVHPKWNIRKVLFFFSFLLIFFFFSYFFLSTREAMLPESTVYNHITHLLNVILSSMAGYSILLFIKHTSIENQNKLISVNRNLKESNKEVRRQYKKQEVLLKEMHHRVKNNLQLISSMISLQKHKLHDPKSIHILENSQNRIHAISLIHQKLFQQEDVAVVNLNFYLQDLVNHLKWLNQNIHCEIKAIDLSINLDVAVPLGLITAELLNNSFKHAFPHGTSGSIFIALRKLEPHTFELSIKDSGKGFRKDFDPKKSSGLGMEIILTLSEQIGAQVEFVPISEGALSIIRFKIEEFNIIG